MLSLLHIENIAVIEEADIRFDAGFNVLTGETGAGKSIVIDAIGAILGERAYRDMIRTGSDLAAVRALFSPSPQTAWFRENGVPEDRDELLISREIHADGRNVCRVNGCAVSVAMLRSLGTHLVQIHGQHDSRRLFDESTHLEILDRFSANDSLRDEFITEFRQWQAIGREIDRTTMDEAEKARRIDTLTREIREIESASLCDGEEQELEERLSVLKNAERLISGLEEACEALCGGDDSNGAASLTELAEASIRSLGRWTSAYEPLHKRLLQLSIDARDMAEELRDTCDEFSYSQEELDAVQARSAQIARLQKKYGSSVADILEYCKNAKNELESIESSEERLILLRKEWNKQEEKARAAAIKLREDRRRAAEELTAKILSELAQLDMPGMRFSCCFEELSDLSENGLDRVYFLMSANRGEDLRPLSRIASGGELARIMLAMQNVLAENESVGTLIFDEVDSGVSGRAAQKVAEKLKSVSSARQVLCVTHLAQLAAQADTHFRIQKHEVGERTCTEVTPLDREGRICELARIIGGAVITDVTRSGAAELLDGAGKNQ